MNMIFFIQESMEENKVKFKIHQLFDKIFFKEINNKIFITLPIKMNTKASQKKAKKLIYKMLNGNMNFIYKRTRKWRNRNSGFISKFKQNRNSKTGIKFKSYTYIRWKIFV